MLVCGAAGFLYRNEGLKLAKAPFKSVDCFDTFYLQGYYRIGKAFLGGCWLCSALWNKRMKMHKALINKLDIIVHLNYLKEMEMHKNIW